MFLDVYNSIYGESSRLPGLISRVGAIPLFLFNTHYESNM